MKSSDSESKIKPRLYFAAPLFSEAERSYNKKVAKLLEDVFEVYLPQEDGGLMFKMIEEGVNPKEAARIVYNLDIIALKKCDVVLMVLDGRSVDEGASFECGYAKALNKPCFGLQTDPRRLLPDGNNPMLSSALEAIFLSTDDLTSWAFSYSTMNTHNVKSFSC